MCNDQLENGQTQDINKQIVLSEDCVVEDITPTRASVRQCLYFT